MEKYLVRRKMEVQKSAKKREASKFNRCNP